MTMEIDDDPSFKTVFLLDAEWSIVQINDSFYVYRDNEIRSLPFSDLGAALSHLSHITGVNLVLGGHNWRKDKSPKNEIREGYGDW